MNSTQKDALAALEAALPHLRKGLELSGRAEIDEGIGGRAYLATSIHDAFWAASRAIDRLRSEQLIARENECPACRGKGGIATGKHSLIEWPCAAFDASTQRSHGNEFRTCEFCHGDGVVTPELSAAIKKRDAEAQAAVDAAFRT